MHRVAALALGLGLVACTGTKGGPDSGDTGASGASAIDGRPCPDGSDLTWENFGQPTMLTHCVGCHSERLEEGVARS